MALERKAARTVSRRGLAVLAWAAAAAFLAAGGPQQTQSPSEGEVGLLRLLSIEASAESIDYVQNKTQFQLHTLLTEQRHSKTWNLGERIQKDTATGLKMLLSVDEDVAAKLEALAADAGPLEAAAGELARTIMSGGRIYVYGCGATGRLAKQMESALWRPFWKSIRSDGKLWAKLEDRLPGEVEGRLIGEMTGADRALISSLEGFEDLHLIGRLQLRDRGIVKGDSVICVTEGGETSSVIGTILAALDEWKALPGYNPEDSRKKLTFVYNNPDDKLLPFLRSRRVLEEPGITKINLSTGPQAITGSTRMQATTIETFVVGTLLESACRRILQDSLSGKEMDRLGFSGPAGIGDGLRRFGSLLRELNSRIPDLAKFTDLEASTYSQGRFSTYFARKGLITVFTDATERSPTFRLYPLDTVKEPRRKCWIQVWTGASDARAAWLAFLGRPFRGLAPAFYQTPFEAEIDDPFLRTAALESLGKAGDDQQDLYDFSYSDFNLKNRLPRPGELGVLAAFSPEEEELLREDSYFRRFLGLLAGSGANAVVLLVTEKDAGKVSEVEQSLRKVWEKAKGVLEIIPVRTPGPNGPFGLGPQVAAKMLLNAHSTAVMAKLGKVIGNTMTNVSPSNLKLIGRATYLIQSHVNDTLGRPAWLRRNGRRNAVSYGEANAVLFDSISYVKGRTAAGQTAEVALSIIRILESLRQRRGLTNDEAFELVQKTGLGPYLASLQGS